MSVKTFPIVLENAFMLSPKVKHFVFRSQQETVFDYLPGQFITIHFEHNQKMIRRSYSIANAPTHNNCIEFSAGFAENGPGTNLLFNLQIGDVLQINGPFGRLTLKEETARRYILVATSTGITPYRAMLNELANRLEQNKDLQVVILQGVQRRENLLFGDEFLAFAAQHPQVTFRAYYSQESEHPLNAHEHRGYVQSAFGELQLKPLEDIVYLCGNPSMIDEAFTYLKENDFPIQHIIREKYISS